MTDCGIFVGAAPVLGGCRWRRRRPPLQPPLPIQTNQNLSPSEVVYFCSAPAVWFFSLLDSRERVPSITTLYESLLESEVSLRGWNSPHFDREIQSNFANGRQSHTIFMHHIEAHRAYQSGLFVWRGSCWENSSPNFAKEHGKALSFVNVIYTVTEFLLFLKRYYERVAPDAAIRFSIEMTDIEDRALVATDWNSLPLPGNCVARVPKLVIEKDYAVPELRANAEEIAISIVQSTFAVFNWNAPDANLIRGWQQRLRSVA